MGLQTGVNAVNNRRRRLREYSRLFTPFTAFTSLYITLYYFLTRA